MEKYLSAVKSEFPEFKYNSYKVFTDGWEKVVLLFDNETAFSFMRKEKYLKEYLNHKEAIDYIHKLSKGRVPFYEYISKINNFIKYKFVHGKQLRRSVFDGLENKNEVAKQLGELLTIIHSVPESISSKFSVRNEADMYNEFLDEIKEALRDKLKNYEYKWILDKYHSFSKLMLKSTPMCVTHQDLNDDHIIWDDKISLIKIIDFGDIGIGDPALDFLWIHRYGKEFFEDVLDSYKCLVDKNFRDRVLYYDFYEIVMGMIDAVNGYPLDYSEAYKNFTEYKSRYS